MTNIEINYFNGTSYEVLYPLTLASQVSGILSDSQIPNLNMSKITEGNLSSSRISGNINANTIEGKSYTELVGEVSNSVVETNGQFFVQSGEIIPSNNINNNTLNIQLIDNFDYLYGISYIFNGHNLPALDWYGIIDDYFSIFIRGAIGSAPYQIAMASKDYKFYKENNTIKYNFSYFISNFNLSNLGTSKIMFVFFGIKK